jgi:hypothetical protein
MISPQESQILKENNLGFILGIWNQKVLLINLAISDEPDAHAQKFNRWV